MFIWFSTWFILIFWVSFYIIWIRYFTSILIKTSQIIHLCGSTTWHLQKNFPFIFVFRRWIITSQASLTNYMQFFLGHTFLEVGLCMTIKWTHIYWFLLLNPLLDQEYLEPVVVVELCKTVSWGWRNMP